MKKAAWLALCLLLLGVREARAAAPEWWSLGYHPTPRAIAGMSEPAWSADQPLRLAFHYRGDFTVQRNPDGEDVRVWLPLPADDAYQAVYLFRLNPPPTRVLASRYGYRIAEFDFGALPDGAMAHIRFDAEAQIGRFHGGLDPRAVGPLEEIPEQIKADYLADGPLYRIHDPAVVAAAREAVGDETNPLHMMGRIAWWVRHRLRYGFNHPKRSAPEVLEIRRGSCTEFSFLMIALARSVGLPTRYMAGSLDVRRSSARAGFDRNMFHKIVEVYLPRLGWTPVESAAGRGQDRTSDDLVGWTANRMFIFQHEPEPGLAPLDPRNNIATVRPFGVASRLVVARDEALQWAGEKK